jgi:hypothetical protein
MQANIMGELVTTKIRKEKYQGFNFMVDKFVNGAYRTTIPCKSHGQAIRISKNITA